MSDPLQELAQANIELGNRPSPAEVPVRRTMSQSDYAAQRLAAAVPPTLIVQQTFHAPRPRSELGFAKGFWVTMGVLAAIFVFSFIMAVMNGCFAAMMAGR